MIMMVTVIAMIIITITMRIFILRPRSLNLKGSGWVARRLAAQIARLRRRQEIHHAHTVDMRDIYMYIYIYMCFLYIEREIDTYIVL